MDQLELVPLPESYGIVDFKELCEFMNCYRMEQLGKTNEDANVYAYILRTGFKRAFKMRRYSAFKARITKARNARLEGRL